tara:strand:+ start:588 stop:803 length:216 start_codon:yes stop_codon:yes gene_type:complete
MCFFGGGSKPPPPPPPAKPPREMNTQPSPTPATAPGQSVDTSAADLKKGKGRQMLKIPLVQGAGSGVQIPS